MWKWKCKSELNGEKSELWNKRNKVSLPLYVLNLGKEEIIYSIEKGVLKSPSANVDLSSFPFIRVRFYFLNFEVLLVFWSLVIYEAHAHSVLLCLIDALTIYHYESSCFVPGVEMVIILKRILSDINTLLVSYA